MSCGGSGGGTREHLHAPHKQLISVHRLLKSAISSPAKAAPTTATAPASSVIEYGVIIRAKGV